MATVDLSLWLLLLIYICVQVSYSLEYTSQWAASIEGGPEKAAEIAMKHDFVILGQIFDDVYHLKHSRIAKRSTRPSHEHHKKLTSEAGVTWAQQQIAKHRMKRDYLKTRSISGISVGRKSRNYYLNDPKWPQMWYLNRGNGLDMNVMKAWQEGITGKGVVVTILDDGLEKDHPDLIQNYDPQASYDVNSHDDDPAPRYDQVDSNRHGTRCAGEVAATANNSLCSVGIAFGASVGGVRMLDGDVTDAVEARSLSLNPQHIDIYSASWGPDDDGKTVDGPGDLATRAFMQGVTKGRKGKGSIFIWASGNGGRDHDNCNCDGYTNSIWTLSIGSATENGLVPWYSEACSSTLATTYSSGASHESQIVTTDLRGTCTSNHTGTSASAPLAAGICALALEANMKLTWRDMQHIVVQTARPANLKTADWAVNGVGRNVSHSFGYGLMDAGAMVELARKWQTVPEQHRCDVSMPLTVRTIPAKSYIALQHTVKKCPGVNYLEHVQAKITLNAQRRGDLRISLTSPHGTTSVLLAQRPHDSSRLGFHQWPFMTVHMWGESPIGTWKLEIHNEGRIFGRATLHEWSLLLYGTEEYPLSSKLNHLLQPPHSLNIPLLPRKNKSRNHKGKQTVSLKPNPKLFNAKKTGKFSSTKSVSKSNTTSPSLVASKVTSPFSSIPKFSHEATTQSLFDFPYLLAPPQQPSVSSLQQPQLPAIFQQYHKVQALIPYTRYPRPSKKGLENLHADHDNPAWRKSSGKMEISLFAFYRFVFVLII
ncbi:furin-like protease 1, isoforms 1/1-X/2 isoform X2 [Bemisia tabaci]|uniref:furin-like protease 1, isoforms 1/1-X/2 isoform X2 n=1 Tax=Bemisia tabaci TaxID=7038 RepID=UPI003B27EBD6